MKTINLTDEQTVLLQAAVQRYSRGLSDQPLGQTMREQCTVLLAILGGRSQDLTLTAARAAYSELARFAAIVASADDGDTESARVTVSRAWTEDSNRALDALRAAIGTEVQS